MNEPSDLARDVLARYRRSISPSAEARDSLVDGVVRRVGGGPGSGGAAPASGGTPWLVVVASALVVAVGVVWMTAPREVDRVDAAFDRAIDVPQSPIEPPSLAVAAPVHVEARTAPTPEVASPLVPAPRAKANARSRRAEAAAPAPSDEAESSLVDEEVRLLRAANVALRAGRDGEARAGFDLHAQRFPDGALVELREVGRALLACRDATPERAIATVDAFGVRFPGSPHLARLTRECPTR